jgi:hypothetical protein
MSLTRGKSMRCNTRRQNDIIIKKEGSKRPFVFKNRGLKITKALISKAAWPITRGQNTFHSAALTRYRWKRCRDIRTKKIEAK